MRIGRSALIAALVLGGASQADAMCQWTFVNGVQQQLCESTIDIPAIRPPAIAPILTPSVPPIMSPMLPPLGTSSCTQAQVWNGAAYVWQPICR